MKRKNQVREIMPTRVLRGKDAVRFWQRLEENKSNPEYKARLLQLLELGKKFKRIPGTNVWNLEE